MVVIVTSVQAQPSSKPPASSLFGIWQNNQQGFQMVLKLNKDYTGEFDGESIQFSTVGSTLSVVQNGETIIYDFKLQGNALTISGGDLDSVITFTRQGTTPTAATTPTAPANKPAPAATAQSTASKGAVPQELVGKWCYVNVYSSSTGGSSTERCITLNADGTYEYFGESSRSVTTPDAYGGTSSQTSDRGTWSVKGDRIYYSSQTQGEGSYALEKKNHPKNGDPMIVLDGDTYVTFYNKAPWR
ncbi:MAG: hypothetical protein ACKOE6_15425 [Flammeovirgaceae bacterium]